ncbi:ubiquitin carboxyl-terminal hydrolase 27 isoform X1 [Aristolochia californica]|uniref:ubiquitin carboxyl-terminal hydrolase 27 isoform X1 n=1 Tax=Aristolochia californica TaxID=171875 RepID=UPI0035DF8B5D
MKSNGKTNVCRLIHTFKHDSHGLFSFKNISPSHFPFLVAGILGAGMGVASLLVAWKDGSARWFHLGWILQGRDSAEELHLVAGLKNLGNNCFMNVILQALASCCCFHSYLQNIIGADDLLAEGRLEKLPLTLALASLLEDLSEIQNDRAVASPQRVIRAIGIYVTTFNLTMQQDAAEALLHLLSSLKEELLECYEPRHVSLADVPVFPAGRISNRKSCEGGSEWTSWQQHLFGPLDGTLGSILTCKTCTFQLSMDFEFFHCLPVSPVLDRNGLIIDGCAVEDCLKKFTSSEYIENYSCSRCWHIAGIKYLSHTLEGNETKIEKLRHCADPDSCDCKNIFRSEAVAWPTIYSHARKQLCIGRSPEILCLHLQRASMSLNGELVKLQGHISFPLVLDFSPFTAAVILGEDTLENDTQMHVKIPQRKPWFPLLNQFNMQAEMLPYVSGLVGEGLSADKMLNISLGSKCLKTLDRELSATNADFSCNTKVPQHQSLDKKRCIYRLVSVVEHYGKAGSGHYAVYRSMKHETQSTNPGGFCWFYISDAEVSSVREEVVLGAEASLLFYEKIDT